MAKHFRSLLATVGALLMIAGLGIVLAVGALYAYGEFERLRVERELPNNDAGAAVETAPISSETPATSLEGSMPGDQSNQPTQAPPTPRPVLPASRITIPKIGVDSIVQEARIENGEWQVPKFVVGHLQGTADPGENGNVVLSGHLESISSGNVFARLGELRPGDAIALYAGDDEFRYQVVEIKQVKNDDLSVVEPTPSPTLTLITCAGTFDVLTRNYSHRLIVVARPSEPD